MSASTIKRFKIFNPKRNGNDVTNFYPYYAGFSSEFASSIIQSSRLPKEISILDPWNGSGTTTNAGSNLGYKTDGIDLNPVMVIISKANMLDPKEYSSLWPITLEIIEKAIKIEFIESDIKSDPLAIWLTHKSIESIRKIERAIQQLLINRHAYALLTSNNSVDNLSGICSFYYVALFRTLRHILKPFNTTNPTWIKTPEGLKNRLRPSLGNVLEIFKAEVYNMIQSTNPQSVKYNRINNSNIKVGSSLNLGFEKETFDLILSSPPYCTRIDYAIATMPELAILGYTEDAFLKLRRALIGTTTVPNKIPSVNPEWGKTCNLFLEKVYNHHSKASKSYYYKSHLQYFNSMFGSISELSRTLKSKGVCVLVVQDSFYKELHNDLAAICSEMGNKNNLDLIRKEEFIMNRTMAGINSRTKIYRNNFNATESVLCFLKS